MGSAHLRNTKENLSDFFTKLLETDTFQRLRDAMMTEQRMPDAETFD